MQPTLDERPYVKSVDMSTLPDVYKLYELDDTVSAAPVVCEACSMLFQSDWFWHHESCALYAREIHCAPKDVVRVSDDGE
jgi:hypothetical protein